MAKLKSEEEIRTFLELANGDAADVEHYSEIQLAYFAGVRDTLKWVLEIKED